MQLCHLGRRLKKNILADNRSFCSEQGNLGKAYKTRRKWIQGQKLEATEFKRLYKMERSTNNCQNSNHPKQCPEV